MGATQKETIQISDINFLMGFPEPRVVLAAQPVRGIVSLPMLSCLLIVYLRQVLKYVIRIPIRPSAPTSGDFPSGNWFWVGEVNPY